MTEDQKKRIAAALREIEATLNEAQVAGDVWIDVHRLAAATVGRPRRVLHEVSMSVSETSTTVIKGGR